MFFVLNHQVHWKLIGFNFKNDFTAPVAPVRSYGHSGAASAAQAAQAAQYAGNISFPQFKNE